MMDSAVKAYGQAMLDAYTLAPQTMPMPSDVAGPSLWKDQVVRCENGQLRQLLDVHPRSHGSQPERLLPIVGGRMLVHPLSDRDPKGKTTARVLYAAGPTERVPPITFSYAFAGYVCLSLTPFEDEPPAKVQTFYLHESSPRLFGDKVVTLSCEQCKREVEKAERAQALTRARAAQMPQASDPPLSLREYSEAFVRNCVSAPRYSRTAAQEALKTWPPEQPGETMKLAVFSRDDLVVVSKARVTGLERWKQLGRNSLRMYAKPVGQQWEGPWKASLWHDVAYTRLVRATDPASPAVASRGRELTISLAYDEYRLNGARVGQCFAASRGRFAI